MMFKNFAMNIISLAFFGTICEMIIPQGSMKKYFKLIMGFIMMIVLLSPVTNYKNWEEFHFEVDEGITQEELNAQSEAYVLKLHEKNIEKYVLAKIGKDADVFVEVYSDGAVKSVVIKCDFLEDAVIESIKEELGCENIVVVNNNG